MQKHTAARIKSPSRKILDTKTFALHFTGTDKYGFGFGGTGKKSNNKQFDSYGEVTLNKGGCYLYM